MLVDEIYKPLDLFGDLAVGQLGERPLLRNW
jgi:hypothetical protein